MVLDSPHTPAARPTVVSSHRPPVAMSFHRPNWAGPQRKIPFRPTKKGLLHPGEIIGAQLKRAVLWHADLLLRRGVAPLSTLYTQVSDNLGLSLGPVKHIVKNTL